jgi:hypothetical protein
MHYEASNSFAEHGVKAHQVTGDEWGLGYIRGRKVVSGGYGSYTTVTPSHLILTIEVEGAQHEVWTEWGFKKRLEIKRLTEKARSEIEAEMPQTVEVEERKGKYKTYFTLADATLDSWAARVHSRRQSRKTH